MLSNYRANSVTSSPSQSNKPLLISLAGGGGALTNANFVDNETPTPAPDGVNDTFTLADTPSPAASLQLFKADIGTGVLMIAGVHYNLVGDTITFTAGNIPAAAQAIRAWYRIA